VDRIVDLISHIKRQIEFEDARHPSAEWILDELKDYIRSKGEFVGD
jgi:hypothetical protein